MAFYTPPDGERHPVSYEYKTVTAHLIVHPFRIVAIPILLMFTSVIIVIQLITAPILGCTLSCVSNNTAIGTNTTAVCQCRSECATVSWHFCAANIITCLVSIAAICRGAGFASEWVLTESTLTGTNTSCLPLPAQMTTDS